MSKPLTRKLAIALPILFYLLALIALRLHLHLPAGDTPLLVVSLLSVFAALGTGALVVLHHRSLLQRVSSGG